ncbi:MAG TPA: glutathione S-transferase [Rhodopila sp.]|jgi:glutathione S-transferase|nr:glutathione S-transferase [Rhodopila sp.]
MKVYEYRAFPNPARVRIALGEKGMLDQVEFVQVDVPAGEHRKLDFVAKNPFAAVPVLELDDGTCIAECTAITEYLDNLDGEPVLTGRTPQERAVVHMMQRRAEAGLLDALVAYFHHATPGLGPDIEMYQNKEWGEHQLHRALDGMRYLDHVVGKQPYLAGESFSMADITAFAGMWLFDLLQLAMPAHHDNLNAWRARVAARPSIRAM